MLRNPSWTAVPASLIALVAVFAPQASHAATDTDTCLAAPKGAAPKGQHWYFHVDRTTKRKCWYLHDTIAGSATKADAPARAAKPVQSSVEPDASRSDGAAAAAAAPAPADVNPAPPQAASGAAAAQSATVWPQSTPAASTSGQDTSSTPSDGAPDATSNATDTLAALSQEAVAQPDTQPVTSTTPHNPSPSSVTQDLLIIGLAAALAAAVSVGFALIGRRKPAKARPAAFVPRAGAAFERQRVDRSRSQDRNEETAPIQPSLVPEQLTMVRPFALPRVRGHNTGDRRVDIDWRQPTD